MYFRILGGPVRQFFAPAMDLYLVRPKNRPKADFWGALGVKGLPLYGVILFFPGEIRLECADFFCLGVASKFERFLEL